MNAKTQTTESTSALDTVKLALTALILVGGLFGYYWFADLALWQRVLIVLASVGVAAAVGLTSAQGRDLIRFVQGSRIELRKVVWPTKQETTQTTIAVFIFTLILGLFFWALDSLLLYITRTLTGQG